MKPLTVEWTSWNQSHERRATSFEDMTRILTAVDCVKSPPPLVEIYDKATGQSFGIGYGRETSVVTYQDSLDPPYFISLGEDTDGVEWFCYGNEHTEYLRSNTIAWPLALDALKEFMESRSRPECLNWERL